MKDKKSLFCSICIVSFTRHSNLKRHNRAIHSTDDAQVFACSKCNNTYSRKYSLKRHEMIKHGSIVPVKDHITLRLICPQCCKTFAYQHSLKRHIDVFHPISGSIDFFECSECHKKFTHKGNLLKHIRHFHPFDNFQQTLFECYYCGKNFVGKSNVSTHIWTQHLAEIIPENILACRNCSKNFVDKSSLLEHISNCTSISGKCRRNPKMTSLKCVTCCDNFYTKRLLNQHYELAHDIILNNVTIQLGSFQKFLEWKKEICCENIIQFRLQSTWTGSSNSTVKLYVCHRSGVYADRRKLNDRQRNLKLSGYKRLGGICPAQILVNFVSVDDACVVRYQSTHVGHPICDLSELKYMSLDEEEKVDIAAKIRDGVPIEKIIEEEYLSSAVSDVRNGRLSILNRYDIHNIAKRYEVKPSRQFGAEANHQTDELIDRNAESILFFKDQFQEDTEFRTLDEHDFFIVIMKGEQEENLRRFGGRLVAFDGTPWPNPYGFVVHALLVLDVDNEGVPVAFAVSTRNDDVVVDLFLTCVRNRVGVVRPAALAGDVQGAYHRSWTRVMRNEPTQLYCVWYVLEEWRRQLSKMACKKKKDEIRERLSKIVYELDAISFAQQLDAFLSSADAALREFLPHFRDKYVPTVEKWAYCYREYVGVSTNMRLESFHNVLKRDIIEGRRGKSLHSCLSYLFTYLVMRESCNFLINIRGKITTRLKNLRSRHKLAEAQATAEKGAILAKSVGDGVWQVGFAQETGDLVQEMFVVARNESKECALHENLVCQLPCHSCNFCYHEYRCTCPDYAIENNMCKHIHAIGIHLKRCNDPDTTTPTATAELKVEEIIVSDLLVDESPPAECPAECCVGDEDFIIDDAMATLIKEEDVLSPVECIDHIHEIESCYLNPNDETIIP